MTFKCEHCGEDVVTEAELDIEHRACRLKAAFPGSYSEQINGLVTFDMNRVAESLGLFNDIVIGRNGQPLHPLEGDLHFRIRASWSQPEVWIELPVQVGNCISSWLFPVTERDWLNLVKAINTGLEEAREYLRNKFDARQT